MERGVADEHPDIAEKMKQRLGKAWTERRVFDIPSGPGRSDYVR